MAQQVRTLKRKSISYNANNQEEENLNRGMVLREIGIRLTGQLTVSAANNTAAKTKRGDEWGVIRKIEIVANNTDVIRSVSGNTLYWLNHVLYGNFAKTTSTIGDATTLNPSFDSMLLLPLWLPRSIRPIDTALDTRNLSNLKMVIHWGDHTYINGDATGFTTDPQVQLESLESFNIQGPFSQLRWYELEKTIEASNSKFQIQLPVNRVYRGFLLNTTNDVAAGANTASDVSTVLNNFKFQSGSTVFADRSGVALKQIQDIRYGIQSGSRRGTANSYDGWYFYDHVSDGMNSEAIDALGFSEIELELDVTKSANTCKVVVVPFELIPVRANEVKA